MVLAIQSVTRIRSGQEMSTAASKGERVRKMRGCDRKRRKSQTGKSAPTLGCLNGGRRWASASMSNLTHAPGAPSPASIMLSSGGSFWRGQFSCGRQERCPPHLYPLYPHPIVFYCLHLTGLSDITVWRMVDSRLQCRFAASKLLAARASLFIIMNYCGVYAAR